MKSALIVFILSGFCFSALAQPIIVGTEATYAPFEYYNKENQLVGFDIDITKRICELSNIHCEFKNQSFDSLIPSLKARRIDAAIASIDVTPTRAEQVLFTTPYYQNSAEFFTKKGTVDTIDELKNKRIGVQNGTTYQKYLLENYPDMQVVSYDSYQNALLDLKGNRINAIFSDAAVGNEWVMKDNTLTVIGKPVTDPDYFGTGFAIAVRKGNDDLVATFNNALKIIQQDGSYKKIYAKWFIK